MATAKEIRELLVNFPDDQDISIPCHYDGSWEPVGNCVAVGIDRYGDRIAALVPDDSEALNQLVDWQICWYHTGKEWVPSYVGYLLSRAAFDIGDRGEPLVGDSLVESCAPYLEGARVALGLDNEVLVEAIAAVISRDKGGQTSTDEGFRYWPRDVVRPALWRAARAAHRVNTHRVLNEDKEE